MEKQLNIKEEKLIFIFQQ